MKKILLLVLMSMLFSGCAVTLPTNAYVPQNTVRTTGQVDLNEFTYKPFIENKVKSNQIQNTAIGEMLISSDVAQYVKRVTFLELEKSGISLNSESSKSINGEVLEFVCDDLGYSVLWKYSIRYFITEKLNGNIIYDETFTPKEIKTGKFGMAMDYANVLGDIVLTGYELFINDVKAKKIIE